MTWYLVKCKANRTFTLPYLDYLAPRSRICFFTAPFIWCGA